MQELAFERVNKHRALAELVIYNRNWLPWWLTTSVVGDFCDQAERYLRGEGLPPLPVRLWWAYRHWKFKRANRMASPNRDRWKQRGPKLDAMERSNITGKSFKAGGIIPLAPGQRAEFIPVVEHHAHEIEVIDMKSGARRKVRVTDRMLRDIGSPQWDTLLPELDPELRKVLWHHEDGCDYEIDATTVTDLKRRSVRSGQMGATIEQATEAFRTFGEAAASESICHFNGLPLAKVTNHQSMVKIVGTK